MWPPVKMSLTPLLYFFAKIFYFSFVLIAFIIAHKSIFMMAALKSQSYNSNICAILVLASFDCFYFTQIEIFLVFGVKSDF